MTSIHSRTALKGERNGWSTRSKERCRNPCLIYFENTTCQWASSRETPPTMSSTRRRENLLYTSPLSAKLVTRTPLFCGSSPPLLGI